MKKNINKIENFIINQRLILRFMRKRTSEESSVKSRPSLNIEL